MNSGKTAATAFPAECFTGAVTIVNAAMIDASTNPSANVDDLEQLIEALHVVRPDSTEIDFFDGVVKTIVKNWPDAQAIFRRLAEARKCLPTSMTMLVYCLQASGSSDWRTEAARLLEVTQDRESVRLIRAMLAKDDLRQAQEVARRTGTFEKPASLVELEQEDEERAVKQEAAQTPTQTPAPDLTMNFRYMRM